MLPRGNLRIGRVGLDVELNEPQFLGYRGTGDGRQLNISGYLRAETLEETQILRNELIAQIGKLVTIAYDTDDTLNGAAIITDADIDIRWTDGALLDPGYFRFEITCEWLGSFAELEYQSLLSMVSAAEDFDTTPSFWHSPPVGARAYSAGGAAPSLIERPTEDGPILVAYNIPPGTHPTWSVDPADYYRGGVELWAGGYLRAGRDMPMDPADWEINAKTIRLRPAVSSPGVSNGRFELAVWNGSDWESWVTFRISWADMSFIPRWDYVTCLRNDAEAVTVRLVRDAVEDQSSTAKHELDITIRRGAHLASFVYKFDGAVPQGHGVYRSSAAAATRPGGTASFIRFDDLIDGSRWFLGTPKAFTAAEVNGGIIANDADQVFPFWIGVAVGDADGNGEGGAALAQQYVGQVAESVRAVMR